MTEDLGTRLRYRSACHFSSIALVFALPSLFRRFQLVRASADRTRSLAAGRFTEVVTGANSVSVRATAWGTGRDVRPLCSGHKGPTPGLGDRRWARRARRARRSTRAGRAMWLGKPGPWFRCAETTIERTSSPRIKEEKMSPDRMVGFARGQLGTADGDRGPRRRSRCTRVCPSISTTSRGYFRLGAPTQHRSMLPPRRTVAKMTPARQSTRQPAMSGGQRGVGPTLTVASVRAPASGTPRCGRDSSFRVPGSRPGHAGDHLPGSSR